MLMKYLKYILLCLIYLNTSSCEKEKQEQESNTITFPVGRSFLNSNEVHVYIGEQEYQPTIVKDNSGGYWIAIPRKDVKDGEKITIRFKRKKQDQIFYMGELGNIDNWIEPSYYIDSDNEMIKQKSVSLTAQYTTTIEKAERLQQFVSNYLTYNNESKYSYYKKASQTFLDKEGTCMNMSRLYVALCRSVDIPARSVWGVVSGGFHHQWAEICDENGNWYASDFGFTKVFGLNDIRYLDLIYAAEENDFIMHRDTTEIMFHNLKYYNDYPVDPSGDLGFERVQSSKDSMVVEYEYCHGKLNIN